MKDVINPFVIRKPNRCIICDNILVLINKEIFMYEMNDDGTASHPPVYEGWELQFKCPICGATYGVINNGFGTYKPAYRKDASRYVASQEVDVPKSVFNAWNMCDRLYTVYHTLFF